MAGKLSVPKMRRVCDELVKGKSLRSICDNDPTMPAWNTVLQAIQRSANAEVQRRRVEIDTMKWVFARMQPRGIRNKAEDVPVGAGTITLAWGGGVDEAVPSEKTADVIKLVPKDA